MVWIKVERMAVKRVASKADNLAAWRAEMKVDVMAQSRAVEKVGHLVAMMVEMMAA